MITRDVKIFLVIYKSHIQGKSLQVFTSIFVKIHSGVSKSVLCNVADRFLNTDKSEILNRRPVAYLVCNQSPPGADGTPSLMTFREVETLFHEVGESFYSSSILVWPRRLWFQKPRTRRPFQYFTPLKIWSLACIMGGGRGFGRMEENEKKGRDTQVCRYSAFSDSLKGLPIHGNFGTILEAIIISNRIRILGTLFWSFVAAKFSLFPVYLNRHWNFLRSVA